MSRKDGQKTFSVDDTAARVRRDALGDEIGYAVETAVRDYRARIVAALRAEAVAFNYRHWTTHESHWLDIAQRIEDGTL